MDLQVLLWALAGGMLVAAISAAVTTFKKDEQNIKHLGRDFVLGALVTGFAYPMIPETFDEMKDVITTKTGDIVSQVATTTASVASGDPGVRIGPPNF